MQRYDGSAIPFRCYTKIRNCGDAINPDIIAALSKSSPYLGQSDKPHILGIGSIFSSANINSFVWGSGVHRPTDNIPLFDPSKVRALRGKLSLQVLKKAGNEIADIPLGDPGCLIRMAFGASLNKECTGKVAVVPHHGSINLKFFRKLRIMDGIEFVDMMDTSLKPLLQIASAKVVLSQSLHGLVFAQALNKPFLWITRRFDEQWLFKFLDWSSTLAGKAISPIGLDVPLHDMIKMAETRESLVDTESLIDSLPVSEVAHSIDKHMIDYLTCRRADPVIVRCSKDIIESLSSGLIDGQSETILRDLANRIFSNWSLRVYTAFCATTLISDAQMDVITRYMDENTGVAFGGITNDSAHLERSASLPLGISVHDGIVGNLGGILSRPNFMMGKAAKCVTFCLP